MRDKVNITSIEFKKFKAFTQYSVKLNNMNILVGPNNCGKSTIISAFRVLGVGIKQAFCKKPKMVKGPDRDSYGYPLSEESLPMAVENVHTDYEEVDTTITFRLSNGNKLVLYFPIEGGCNLIPDAGVQINSPNKFKTYFPIKLEIIPVLGPLEQHEKVLTEDTVRKGQTTHRASRHFRNYWMYYPKGFDVFAELVKKTWPGMEIEVPKRIDLMSNGLTMFCKENRILREIYWSGLGFQVWCQILTHISRCHDATILIVDEPEVYLHPDVQRQLLTILKYAGPDIVIATHSTEIMGEADASEILLINKKKKAAERLRDIIGVQKALETVGSIQNITLTQLARNGRILFVEGFFDYKIIRRFARKLGLIELSSGNDITAFESGGFSSWDKIKSFAWGFKTTLNSDIHVGAIFDRDYWCEEELNEISNELNGKLDFAHIHKRKEIENYLLVPSVLERVLANSIKDREKRTGEQIEESETIYHILDRVSNEFVNESQSQYIARRIDYFKKSSQDSATITVGAIEKFNKKWKDLNLRMEIVPGKETLRLLRSELQRIYSVNITDAKIIDEFKKEEIPNELIELLFKIEGYRSI